MTKMFSYSSISSVNDHAAPIWSDFDSNSKFSIMMREAKQKNDDTFWDTMRSVINHDCETLPMERFKVWASVFMVPLMSNAKLSPYIRLALNAVAENPIYVEALTEPMIGCNEQDHSQFFDMFCNFRTTMNRIQNLGHLLMCGYTAESISKMKSIVEIGSGVGDMPDIVNKLGFTGDYLIYDFPELSRIQKWYHDKLGHTNIRYSSDPKDLHNSDLLIATFSFTEMPLDLRDEIVPLISDSKNILIAYAKEIFGMDNEKYLVEKFIPNIKGEVSFIDMVEMHWDGGNKYLSIKEKSNARPLGVETDD